MQENHDLQIQYNELDGKSHDFEERVWRVSSLLERLRDRVQYAERCESVIGKLRRTAEEAKISRSCANIELRMLACVNAGLQALDIVGTGTLPSSRGALDAVLMMPKNEIGIRVVHLERTKKKEGSDPDQSGIGIIFGREDDGTHSVCALYNMGPAARSGRVFPGDKLLSIDAVPTHGLSVTEVQDMIMGLEHTEVALTLETLAPPLT
jgi:hypothetical protein